MGPRQNITLDAAKALCSAAAACHGITFKAAAVAAGANGTIGKVYFKFGVAYNDDAEWPSYLRDYSAVKARARDSIRCHHRTTQRRHTA